MRYLLIIICMLISHSTAAQSAEWFAVDGGLKVVDGQAGFGLSGKISFQQSSFFMDVNPLDLTLIPTGEKEGYRSETTSDGRSICRDTSNGRFANKSNCAGLDVLYAFSGSVNYFIKKQEFMMYAGPGFRLGDATTPFVNIGVIFDTGYLTRDYHWFGKASFGGGLFEISVGTSFAL